MSKQLGFHFDASACIGCKACQMACKDKNDSPIGVNFRRVIHYTGGSWVPDANQRDLLKPSGIFGYFVSVACNHCEDAPCVKVCPTAAMTKRDDGIVVVDQDKCIGCRYCQWVCPYGAPQLDDRTGRMTKCNLCEDLLEEGQNPACVDSCPMRALDFGEIEELRAKYGDVDAVEPLPSGEDAHPALVITPHPRTPRTGTRAGQISGMYTL